MKTLAVLIGMLALVQPVAAQSRLRMDATGRVQGQQQAKSPTDAERDVLRKQVFQIFMDRATERLGLDVAGRARLEQVLRQNEARRRELGRDSKQIRQDIQTALQNNASDAELNRMLDKLAEFRTRDLANWRTEQAELARVLTPRQRAQFIGLRAEMFDRVQQMKREKQRQQSGGQETPPGAQ